LTGLRAYGYHGVLDFERADGQEFVVDARLELDTRPAALSDDLADTVSYAEVAERLVGVVTGEPVALLEKLAQLLADECLTDPRIAAAEVTVHKPSAPIPHEFSDVTVTVRRDRATRGGK
jgi:dihydroneopterin aldolase